MIYSNIKTPVWANAENTAINCFVTFEQFGEVPFTASKNDTKYSNEIFERCLSGEFGLIADYIVPIIAPAPNQPTTTGTQSL